MSTQPTKGINDKPEMKFYDLGQYDEGRVGMFMPEQGLAIYVPHYFILADPKETIEEKLAAAERRVHNFIDAICEREHINNQFAYEVLMMMPYYWKQYEVDKKRFDEHEKIADQIKQLKYL